MTLDNEQEVAALLARARMELEKLQAWVNAGDPARPEPADPISVAVSAMLIMVLSQCAIDHTAAAVWRRTGDGGRTSPFFPIEKTQAIFAERMDRFPGIAASLPELYRKLQLLQGEAPNDLRADEQVQFEEFRPIHNAYIHLRDFVGMSKHRRLPELRMIRERLHTSSPQETDRLRHADPKLHEALNPTRQIHAEAPHDRSAPVPHFLHFLAESVELAHWLHLLPLKNDIAAG